MKLHSFAATLVFILAPVAASPAMATTIMVGNSAELFDALQVATAGGTIYLRPSKTPYTLYTKGGLNPVAELTIRSADPKDPATFDYVWLSKARNITVTDVRFDSSATDRESWLPDIFVQNSQNITLSDLKMRSTAAAFYDGEVPLGRDVMKVRDVQGLRFLNNTVSHYANGMQIEYSKDIEIAGNTVTRLQFDGLQMGGVNNVRIVDNTFARFFGSANDINHDDAIQFWSTKKCQSSSNILIQGNRIHSDGGSGTQSIFLGAECKSPEFAYNNVEIRDNDIRNNDWHGITVDRGDHVIIENNNVSLDPDATYLELGNDGIYIEVKPGARNVTVRNNCADRYDLASGTTASGNITSPSCPNDAPLADLVTDD